MRTNIEIDDKLMSNAMKAGGFLTKKETVEEALRLLTRHYVAADIRALRGSIKWTGDIDEMRRDRLDYNNLWPTTSQLAKELKP